ncbi:MAG: Rieske 2Fe-2S domain-containing protein [Proteobacteria bacterium]|nr:Rieske 2Fe-2S domain-containing protein [Pseudomonadota bacterium]
MSDELVCSLDDIEDGAAKALVVRVEGKQRNVVALRRDPEFHVFINNCPHASQFLDAVPGKFIGPNPDHIRCGMHGALFRLSDGFCTAGPCEGESLKAVPIEVRGSDVFVVE